LVFKAKANDLAFKAKTLIVIFKAKANEITGWPKGTLRIRP